MGRPSKLAPQVQARIVQAIALGSVYELAAGYGGISYNTLNEWMKKGEAAKGGPFREFYEAVKEAEGAAAVGWLAKIEKAANDGAWQAAAWKLERRYPKHYGRTVHEHTGKDGERLSITLKWGDEDGDA